MTIVRSMVTVAFLAILAVAPSAAQQSDILKAAVNDISAGWTAYGPHQSSRQVDDGRGQGGVALRIEIGKAGSNVWDDGVTAKIVKPVKKGDRLLLAFWVRAPSPHSPKDLALPFAGVTQAQAPYGQVVKGMPTLGTEWKLVEVRGQADADYAAGMLQAAVQLSLAKTVVEFGPVFVLNLGQPRG